MSFKVKYCHRIFEHKEVREECQRIIMEVASKHSIQIMSMGFDTDHLHLICDLGHYSEVFVKKLFKGNTAKKLFDKFPWLKRMYFWGSGLWGRQYYCYSIGSDMQIMNKYLEKQKFYIAMNHPDQKTLGNY